MGLSKEALTKSGSLGWKGISTYLIERKRSCEISRIGLGPEAMASLELSLSSLPRKAARPRSESASNSERP